MFVDIKILPAKEEHTATLIFLHGLGENADDWIEKFRDVLPPYVKLLCPQGGEISFKPDGETSMRTGWYHVAGTTQMAIDEADTEEVDLCLKQLIDEESKNVPTERIIIGGFSQGGSIALYVAFSYEKKLGGIITLSTYVVSRKKTAELAERNKQNRLIPYYCCHGTADVLIPYISGQYTFHTYRKYFKPAYFKPIPDMGHTVIDEEIRDVVDFIKMHVRPV